MCELPKAYLRPMQRRPWQPKKVAFEGITNRTTFYSNAAWRKFRAWYMAQHPYCDICDKYFGKLTPATELHHIKSVNPDNPLDDQAGTFGRALDPDNCQSLCFDCHISETSKRKRHG